MARYALLRLRLEQGEAEPVTEVNVIPVIDISLVLLVILFVTAPLLSTPNLPVSLPEAAAGAADGAGAIAVTLGKDGRLAVRSADVAWEELGGVLRRALLETPDAVVLLRVDKSVPYRAAQRLLAASKAAGARRVALGTASR